MEYNESLSAHRLSRRACSGDWVLAYGRVSIGLGSFHAPCTSTAPSALRDGGLDSRDRRGQLWGTLVLVYQSYSTHYTSAQETNTQEVSSTSRQTMHYGLSVFARLHHHAPSCEVKPCATSLFRVICNPDSGHPHPP